MNPIGGSEILIIAAVIGMLPAAIASSKGHNFFVWWIFGFLLFIVALPLSIVARPTLEAALATKGMTRATVRPCPACKSPMPRADARCPACGTESQPWRFHEGRWWITNDAAAWFWLDEQANRWMPAPGTTADQS